MNEQAIEFLARLYARALKSNPGITITASVLSILAVVASIGLASYIDKQQERERISAIGYGD